MLPARPPHPDPRLPRPGDELPQGPRFRVLLTEDRARPDEHWTRQVPALLRPLGVDARIASTGPEALDILKAGLVHAAVIDLNTPAPNAAGNDPGAGGLWLMQVIHRLPARPPVVVVNSRSYSQRQVQRLLNQALDLGAFSVINWPVQLDTLLSTFQRLLERAYNNHWPPESPPPPEAQSGNDTN
jgi:CheY-like chemotaxis protein